MMLAGESGTTTAGLLLLSLLLPGELVSLIRFLTGDSKGGSVTYGLQYNQNMYANRPCRILVLI